MPIRNRICMLPILLLLTLPLACVKYEAAPFNGQHLPRRSGYVSGVTDDWIYYNLRTGKIHHAQAPYQSPLPDPIRLSTDWDIAFCGTQMRTNSGTSGPGSGGAIDLGLTRYHDIQLADLPSQPQWIPDNDTSVHLTYSLRDWTHHCVTQGLDPATHPWFNPNTGPRTRLTSANPVLANAIVFSAPPPSYQPSMHVYVIRGAEGKRLYKLQILSWYHEDTQPAHPEGGLLSFYLQPLL